MKYLRLLFLGIITLAISSVLLTSGCGDDDDILVPKTSWQKEIGPAGGTVVVAERSSPIYGVKIEIPAGALAQKATIIISESDDASSPAIPIGTRSDYYSVVAFSSTAPFSQNIKITFPIGKYLVADGEVLSSFYLPTGGTAWTPVLPSQIIGKQMIIETDHLSAWKWGVISLDDVESGTVAAALEEIFYVDNLGELKTAVENRLATFTSTFNDWIDYWKHWEHCSDRQAVADILHGIIQVTEAGITQYLGTQSVIDACDKDNICGLSHMLITDEQGRLMKWAEVEVRALFGDAFWSMLPGFGGAVGDIFMDLLGKALLEGQYKYAVEHELGCDYRCILKNGNFNFYVNVVVCNISYLALFGMEVYQSYDPCIP